MNYKVYYVNFVAIPCSNNQELFNISDKIFSDSLFYREDVTSLSGKKKAHRERNSREKTNWGNCSKHDKLYGKKKKKLQLFNFISLLSNSREYSYHYINIRAPWYLHGEYKHICFYLFLIRVQEGPLFSPVWFPLEGLVKQCDLFLHYAVVYKCNTYLIKVAVSPCWMLFAWALGTGCRTVALWGWRHTNPDSHTLSLSLLVTPAVTAVHSHVKPAV